MSEETQTTVKSEVTQEPQKNKLDYAMETLELNRMVGIGMILLACATVYASYKGMLQSNASPDTIKEAMTSFKEITLILVGALAGVLQRK